MTEEVKIEVKEQISQEEEKQKEENDTKSI